MPDIVVSYKGNSILQMSASGTKTLETKNLICTDDITVQYTQPSGGTSRISFTESVGYINADGTIHTPDATMKEVYTSLIPVTEMLFYLKNATSVAMWACVCTYDANSGFIARTQLVNSNRTSHYTMPTVTGASFVRFTYRTYGTIERYVYDLTR